MDKKTVITVVVALAAGVIFAQQIRRIPGVSKLPTY